MRSLNAGNFLGEPLKIFVDKSSTKRSFRAKALSTNLGYIDPTVRDEAFLGGGSIVEEAKSSTGVEFLEWLCHGVCYVGVCSGGSPATAFPWHEPHDIWPWTYP